MEYNRLEQTYVVRLDPGEEILAALSDLCRRERIGLASVTGLGAVGEAVLGVFDTEAKRYDSKEYQGHYEIASLMGTVTQKDGNPYLHLHAVIGNPVTGECHGGHLNRGLISATGELMVTVVNGRVERRMDETVGLNLMEFEK